MRAKAACDYAKQLNPALSTWFQNKPTNARSYAGKVLLTIKTDQDLVGSSSTLSASYPYPACDTAAKQPLTRVQDKNWQIYGAECATDRTLPTTALERVVTSGPMEPCMLKETSPERVRYAPDSLITGFPRTSEPIRLGDGDKNVLIVAFDWPDLKDDIEPETLLRKEATMFADYFENFSRGKVKLNIEIHPDRIMLLEPSGQFSQSERQQNTSQHGDENVNAIDFFYQQMILASDPFIDYTGIDILLFVPPRFEEVFAEFNLWPPITKSYPTDEEPIVRAFTPGGGFHFRPENSLWAFWVHETMHYFKLPDLYWSDQNSVKREPYTFSGPMHGMDLMDGTYNRSLNSWLMGLADWSLAGEQLCLTPSNFEDSSYEIFPVSNNDDTLKSVMIKLSETELIAVESRRLTKFDHIPQRSTDGVFIYHVDTSIAHGNGALTALAPEGRTLVSNSMGKGGNNATMLDAIFFEGNTIEIAGYKITVNKALASSDIVSISKIPDWVPGQEAKYVCLTMENRIMNDANRKPCTIG
jgi:hypothetical protein